jgi:hypothetical protein
MFQRLLAPKSQKSPIWDIIWLDTAFLYSSHPTNQQTGESKSAISIKETVEELLTLRRAELAGIVTSHLLVTDAVTADLLSTTELKNQHTDKSFAPLEIASVVPSWPWQEQFLFLQRPWQRRVALTAKHILKPAPADSLLISNITQIPSSATVEAWHIYTGIKRLQLIHNQNADPSIPPLPDFHSPYLLSARDLNALPLPRSTPFPSQTLLPNAAWQLTVLESIPLNLTNPTLNLPYELINSQADFTVLAQQYGTTQVPSNR